MILDQPYRGSNPYGRRSRPGTEVQHKDCQRPPISPKSGHTQPEIIDRTDHPLRPTNSDCNQPAPDSQGNRLSAGSSAQLVQNRTDVELDGMLGDA